MSGGEKLLAALGAIVLVGALLAIRAVDNRPDVELEALYRYDTIAQQCFARTCIEGDCAVLLVPRDACDRVGVGSGEPTLRGL